VYALFWPDGPHFEHVYLEWAEERCIDITVRAFTNIVHGRQQTRGGIADFHGEITAVECALG